jgi:hypothetical protein
MKRLAFVAWLVVVAYFTYEVWSPVAQQARHLFWFGGY